MSDAVAVIALLGAGTYALKAAGPLALGVRPIPDWLSRLSRLAPAALLASLIAASTFVTDTRLVLDARLAGLAAAAVALRLKAPFAVVVLVAAAVTATVRAL